MEMVRREVSGIKIVEFLNFSELLHAFRFFISQILFALLTYRIDATPESNKRLGRLVNHCRRNFNLIPRPYLLDGHEPRVVLIASKPINPGEQLCYDYGDYDKDSIREHEWLLTSTFKIPRKIVFFPSM